MDELPADAKAWLALAREADHAPAGASERVRRRVAVAVGAAGAVTLATWAKGSGSAAPVKTALLASSSAKLAVVAAALAALGGTTFAVLHGARDPQRPAAAPHAVRVAHAGTVPKPSADMAVVPTTETQNAAESQTREVAVPQAPAPAVAVPQAPEQGHALAAPEASAVGTAPTVGSRRLAAQPPSAADAALSAEMDLLSQASAALNAGDAAAARALLTTHRARYRDGQLRQERQALEVLARCVANEPGAGVAARAYLRRVPDGILAARIESACATSRPR